MARYYQILRHHRACMPGMVKVTGFNMRNSHGTLLSQGSDAFMVDDATQCISGAVVGFVSWLLAL